MENKKQRSRGCAIKESLQETYAEKSICFGCGPANKAGLRIRSFAAKAADGADVCVCEWTPRPEHHAFPGVLNGGILGSILDCHCNWTACYFLMKRAGADQPPCTVTAEYTVKMKRPTPMNVPLKLEARVKEISDDRATIECTLTANGKVTATCSGVFVSVKPDHPAYHRW